MYANLARRFLYAGGAFTTISGQPIVRIAMLNNGAWQGLGSGADNLVRAMCTFDPDGDGPLPEMLYAGGSFTTIGGVSTSRVAVWDGGGWNPIGAGFNGNVLTLAMFDADGAGPGTPVLYAGGTFSMSGAATVSRVAAWNGSAWTTVGGGISGTSVATLCLHDDDGDGALPPRLIVGGTFTSAGGMQARNIVRWDGTSYSNVGPVFSSAELAWRGRWRFGTSGGLGYYTNNDTAFHIE